MKLDLSKKLDYQPLFSNQTYQLVLLGLMCILPLFVNNGIIDPGIMEARNYITAREMVANDNWVLTTMNGYPRLEKPPLPTWITAIAGVIGGDPHMDNLAVVRFPAVLITCLMAYFVFFFAKTLTTDRLIPFMSAAVLITSFYVIYMGRQGTWDIYCHAFMIGAIWLLYNAWEKKENSIGRFIIIGILLGLAFLSKGPIPFYAMLLPFLIAYIVAYRGKNITDNWQKGLLALGICIVVSAAWPVYIYFTVPDVSHYVYNKETGAWANRHVKPFYQYISYPFQAGIWCFMICASLFFPYAKKRIEQYGNYVFLAVWVVAGLFLLSVIPEKKERYLLPVLVPQAILTAFYLRMLIAAFEEKRQNKLDRFVFSFNTILFAIIALAVPIYIYIKIHTLPILGIVGLSILFFGLAFTFILSYRNRDLMLLFFGMVAMTSFTLLAMPPFVRDVMYTNPDYTSLREVRKQDAFQSLNFYSVGEVRPEQIWEIGKPVDTLYLENNKWNIHVTYPIAVFSREPLQELLPKGDSLLIEQLAVYPYHRSKPEEKFYFSKVEPNHSMAGQ